METLLIETERLIITEFQENMVESVHQISQDEDNRRFVPDEVFETSDEARDAVQFLMGCYRGMSGPFVYPILLKSGEYIGYVQAVPLNGEWEVGYHISASHTKNGYATEALQAFMPWIMQQLNLDHIWGICDEKNLASQKVLERCSFYLMENGSSTRRGEKYGYCKYQYVRDPLINNKINILS